MNIIAVQKSVRQTPRKVALVVSALKGMPVEQAIMQLGHIQRRATVPVLKVVRQAVANAQHNHGLTIDQLTLHSIEVTSGTQFKRFQAVSRGRAHSIVKKTSHIKVILSVVEETTGVSKKTPQTSKDALSAQANKSTKQSTATARTQTGVAPEVREQVAQPPVVKQTKVAASAPVVPMRQSHQRRGSK